MTLLGAFSASHGFVNSLHRSRKLDQLVGRAPRAAQQFNPPLSMSSCRIWVAELLSLDLCDVRASELTLVRVDNLPREVVGQSQQPSVLVSQLPVLAVLLRLPARYRFHLQKAGFEISPS